MSADHIKIKRVDTQTPNTPTIVIPWVAEKYSSVCFNTLHLIGAKENDSNGVSTSTFLLHKSTNKRHHSQSQSRQCQRDLRVPFHINSIDFFFEPIQLRKYSLFSTMQLFFKEEINIYRKMFSRESKKSVSGMEILNEFVSTNDYFHFAVAIQCQIDNEHDFFFTCITIMQMLC